MTDSDLSMGVGTGKSVPLCKTIPGFGKYAAYAHPVTLAGVTGQVLSIRNGIILKARPDGDGYPQVNLTDDQGTQRTRAVHVLVLLAWAGECPPGQEASHINDVKTDNRWPENLVWEPHPDNERRKFDNGRPKPVPPRHPKTCILCLQEFTGSGRRCHRCVVKLAKQARKIMRRGVRLEKAAALLEYPSAVGLHTLAQKYAYYGRPWWYWLAATVRDRLRSVRGDGA